MLAALRAPELTALRASGCPAAARRPSSKLDAMFKLVKKWWKYLTAKLTGSFNERADPKVQLEQAIAEAQNQHRRLREQAANVIANQKQGELRLNAKMTELEKLNANARQALIMAVRRREGRRRDEGGAVHARRPRRSPTS